MFGLILPRWRSATSDAARRRLRDGGWMSEKRPKRGRALAVPPGPTHYGSFASPLFAAFALDFLDGPQRETTS